MTSASTDQAAYQGCTLSREELVRLLNAAQREQGEGLDHIGRLFGVERKSFFRSMPRPGIECDIDLPRDTPETDDEYRPRISAKIEAIVDSNPDDPTLAEIRREPLLQLFRYSHVTDLEVRRIAARFCDLARQVSHDVNGPMRSRALLNLRASMDCATSGMVWIVPYGGE